MSCLYAGQSCVYGVHRDRQHVCVCAVSDGLGDVRLYMFELYACAGG